MGDALLLVWQAVFVQKPMRNLLTYTALKPRTPQVRLTVTTGYMSCYE